MAMVSVRLERAMILLSYAMCFLLVVQGRALRGQQSKPGLGGILHLRSRRGSTESQLDQCTILTAPWSETIGSIADQMQIYRIRVLSMSQETALRTMFPEQPLFRYSRRIYRCCQLGYHCGSVKGIQGRIYHGNDLEFILSHDVLSIAVIRAELHLHFSNPQNLMVQPRILYLDKRKLPTRYYSWSLDGVEGLKLDLLFFFQALQQAMGGPQRSPSLIHMRRVGDLARTETSTEPWSGPHALQDTEAVAWGKGEAQGPLHDAVELGFSLHCQSSGVTVPCEANGLRLQHAPFITFSYR